MVGLSNFTTIVAYYDKLDRNATNQLYLSLYKITYELFTVTPSLHLF